MSRNPYSTQKNWRIGHIPARSDAAPPGPVVDAITPTTVDVGSTATIILWGRNLATTTAVLFDGTPRAHSVVSDTRIEVSASGLLSDVYSVTIVTPSGTSYPVTFSVVESGGAAPTLSNLSPSVADGLAEPVVITGTGFVVGASVHFMSAGSFVAYAASVSVDSPTQITFTTPGIAADVYDVVVTNPDLQAVTGSMEIWHPLVDSPSLLLLPGDFASPTPTTVGTATWTDSSGNGNHAVAQNTNPTVSTTPIAGCPVFIADSALNVPKSFADEFSFPTLTDRLADRDNGEVVIIDVPTVLAADGGAYFNAALICGEGATPGLAPVDDGLRMWAYDGSSYLVPKTTNPPAVDVPEVCFMGWDASGVEVRKDGGAVASAPYTAGYGPLSAGNIGAVTYIGASYAYSYLYSGTIRLVAVFRTKKSNAWRTRFRTWAQGRGYLAT